MGLFTLGERIGSAAGDDLAAALLDAADGPEPPVSSPTVSAPIEHWRAAQNGAWRWLEREHLVDGEWRLTGMTIPVRRDTGEPIIGREGYLDASAAPEALRAWEGAPPADDDLVHEDDPPGPVASAERRGRHGRPPSRWLRRLGSEELSVWLATVDPPEAGVAGMSFLEHLTRDHGFDADRLAGLTDAEQAKLHAAAHHGY